MSEPSEGAQWQRKSFRTGGLSGHICMEKNYIPIYMEGQ